MQVDAVVFDFDGIILETEEPLYRAWKEIFEAHGATLSIEEWAVSIGSSDHMDPVAVLEARTGQALDASDLHRRRKARRDSILAEMEMAEGVADCLRQAHDMGLPLGVASSSDRRWVEGHLERLGLLKWFSAVSCVDDVGVAKPSPLVYLHVLDRLGVAAERAVAFEDSHNGLVAAKAAGMRCIVVPTVMTGHMDFSLADRVVATLHRLPLAELLASLD